ncbi:MAG: 3-dehydroquinate synthase, partial [Kiritimatiellae bacterium]|nr:3-dehydroquinate synthase [Kiritimatiellia bacterium]
METAAGTCPVHVGRGALVEAGRIAASAVRGRIACVVSDSNVAPLHCAAVEAPLSEAGFKTERVTVPAGEKSKDLAMLSTLWEEFHRIGLARRDIVVAVGGGVVGDLAGFAAATWMRGVAVMQVPTSLLAMVDSSIGGKTAVDLPFGKNLVGAFHQPVAVLADPDVLATLPEREFVQGMAETVKYGCIFDADFFAWLESLPDAGPGPDDVERIVVHCAKAKAEVVTRDERESGLRTLLNFGHTVGHAAEKALGYGAAAHGEAVAAGMVAAARFGESLGVTEPGTEKRLAALLRKLRLPVRVGELAGGAG